MRFFLLLFLLISTVPAQTADPWAPLSFLIGNWVGEGDGTPGQGTGGFSFLPDLDKKILVRKNRADYPATKDRPAFSHTDLMIVHKEGERFTASYFDSEDHVIQYGVQPAADGASAEFVSAAATPGPRYRLTYRKTAADTIAIKFEIAPPGKPDAFATYITASARRKGQ